MPKSINGMFVFSGLNAALKRVLIHFQARCLSRFRAAFISYKEIAEMPWVKLDDGFSEDKKVLQAGPLAMALHVAALCYCNRHLTDGLVPRAALPQLVNLKGLMYIKRTPNVHQLARRLVNVGLWERENRDYHIHDFLDYQPSRREIETRRKGLHQIRSEAGAGSKQNVHQMTSNLQPRPVPSRPVPSPSNYPPNPPKGGNNERPRKPRRQRSINDPEASERIMAAARAVQKAWPDFGMLRAARASGFDVNQGTQAEYEAKLAAG